MPPALRNWDSLGPHCWRSGRSSADYTRAFHCAVALGKGREQTSPGKRGIIANIHLKAAEDGYNTVSDRQAPQQLCSWIWNSPGDTVEEIRKSPSDLPRSPGTHKGQTPTCGFAYPTASHPLGSPCPSMERSVAGTCFPAHTPTAGGCKGFLSAPHSSQAWGCSHCHQ